MGPLTARWYIQLNRRCHCVELLLSVSTYALKKNNASRTSRIKLRQQKEGKEEEEHALWETYESSFDCERYESSFACERCELPIDCESYLSHHLIAKDEGLTKVVYFGHV